MFEVVLLSVHHLPHLVDKELAPNFASTGLLGGVVVVSGTAGP